MESTPSGRQGFMRRLGYYAIGLAVGFVLLGFFQQRRAGEKFLREQAMQTGQLEHEAVTPDSAPITPEVRFEDPGVAETVEGNDPSADRPE